MSRNLTEVRRDLYQAYLSWDERQREFDKAVLGGAQDGATLAAYGGCLMAATYSYALAAALKVAAEDFGSEAAEALASVVDGLLENGDLDNLNADLDPAGVGTPS